MEAITHCGVNVSDTLHEMAFQPRAAFGSKFCNLEYISKTYIKFRNNIQIYSKAPETSKVNKRKRNFKANIERKNREYKT